MIGVRWYVGALAPGTIVGVRMSLTLLDWRRRIARLYAEIRAEPDIVAAHDHWHATRDDLLRTHPDSPVPGPPAQATRARRSPPMTRRCGSRSKSSPKSRPSR